MKYIRWKAVIPLLVFIIGLSIFFRFYFDTLLKNIIVSIGESIFSAKVEVGYLKTKFKESSVEIRNFQVADKSDPWRNLFEVEKIKFDIQFLPLLSKKFIIDEMSIEDIKWSTQRTTSGELPPKKIKKIEKKKRKEKDTFTSKLLDRLKDKVTKEVQDLPLLQNFEKYKQEFSSLDVKKIVDEFDLETKQLIDTLNKEKLQKYENYKNEIQNLDVDQKISVARELINEISNIKLEKPEDIKVLQNKLSELNEKKKVLENTYENLKSLKTSIDKDFVETKEIYSKIKSSIDKDYENILSKLKLPEFSKENISRALFGEIWINRVNKAVYYIHLARKYLPKRNKEDKKITKQRMRGIDVEFFKENVLPSFWIKKIVLSATTGGPGKDNDNAIVLSGIATNFSSDQVIVGKPAIISLQGKKSLQEYLIDCIFDRLKEIPEDTIQLNIKNINISNYKISSTEFMPEVKNGVISIDSIFSLKGEELNCEMQFLINNIKFSEISNMQNEEIKIVLNDIFTSINKIYIKAKLYGTINSLSTEISSNIDDIIVNKLKSIFGQKLQEYQTKIKSEVEKNILEQKEKFVKEYEEKRNELTKIFNDKKSSIEDLKKQIEDKQKEVNKQIEDFNNKIKQTLEQEKKKVEEELKKRFLK